MTTNTQISDAMVEAFIAAFNGGIFHNAAFGLPEDERCRCKQCLQEEAAAIATVRDGLAAALAGHVVVPREPTREMIDAATTTTSGYGGPDHDYDDDVREQYRAMISAAPPALEREG